MRQWVLTLPHRVRFLCAYDPQACGVVRRILVRAVSGLYLQGARRVGLPRAKAAAVVFQQRFDSAVRLNVHHHGLWADGAFADAPGTLRATFHPQAVATDRDVADLLRAIATRVRRWLRKHGLLQGDVAPADDPAAAEPSLLQELGAAAIQGRAAQGPQPKGPLPQITKDAACVRPPEESPFVVDLAAGQPSGGR